MSNAVESFKQYFDDLQLFKKGKISGFRTKRLYQKIVENFSVAVYYYLTNCNCSKFWTVDDHVKVTGFQAFNKTLKLLFPNEPLGRVVDCHLNLKIKDDLYYIESMCIIKKQNGFNYLFKSPKIDDKRLEIKLMTRIEHNIYDHLKTEIRK